MSITTENKVGMIDSIELFVPKGDWSCSQCTKPGHASTNTPINFSNQVYLCISNPALKHVWQE